MYRARMLLQNKSLIFKVLFALLIFFKEHY